MIQGARVGWSRPSLPELARVLACAVLLTILSAPPALAQSNSCVIRATLSLDFADPAVAGFDARVPNELCARGLTVRGLEASRWEPPHDDSTWSVRGAFPAARLRRGGDDRMHLTLGPFALNPDDRLILSLPFAQVVYPEVTPLPANLADLLPERPLGIAIDGVRAMPRLEYIGDGQPLTIEIPFSPVRKHIELTLTPLLAEMLRGETDAFRVSGRVVFAIPGDPGEVIRYCQSGTSPVDTYRGAALLFAIDSPPRFNFALLPPVYDAKPTYLSIVTRLTTCDVDSGGGHVEMTFNGRAFETQPDLAVSSEDWTKEDVLDCNRPLSREYEPDQRQPAPICERGRRTRDQPAYEIIMGEVVLGPEDDLWIQVPGADVKGVDPPPTRASFGNGVEAPIVYQGPRRFALHVVYTPAAGMVVQQLPNTARAMVAPVEAVFAGALESTTGLPACPSCCPPPTALLAILLAAAGLVLLAARTVERGKLIRPAACVLWGLTTLGLVYAMRGSFGLFAGAVLLGLMAPGRGLGQMARGVGALVLVLLASQADCITSRSFDRITRLDLETTPLTPVVILGLGIALATLHVTRFGRLRLQFDTSVILVLTLGLVGVISFDVFQKSLLGLAMVGLSTGWVALRLMSGGGPEMSTDAIVARLNQLCQRPIVPTAIVVMAVFAFENGLNSTKAVFADTQGQWSAGLGALLLLVSIAVPYLGLALLVAILFPLLPFKPGYLKGVTVGLLFFGIFLVGLGADHRLITSLPNLIVGRLVYYLSIPVLVGVYLELRQTQAHPVAAHEPSVGTVPSTPATPLMYAEMLRQRVNTISGVIAIVAPGLYAATVKSPVVTSYFDLLDQLLRAGV